jgi:hypothetical protein
MANQTSRQLPLKENARAWLKGLFYNIRVGGLAWPREVERHPILVSPAVQRLRDKLGSIIQPDRLGCASDRCDPVRRLYHLFALDALIDVDRQSLPGISINHGQCTQAPAVEQGVGDEIHRPQPVGCQGRRLPLALGGADMPTWSLEP